MDKSPRPKARPADLVENYNLSRAMKGPANEREKQDRKTLTSPKSSAPAKSPRPRANPENRMGNAAKREEYDRKTLTKMAMGGTCRGMGAAKKGGKYSKAG